MRSRAEDDHRTVESGRDRASAALSQYPPAHAAQMFLIALVLVGANFTLAKTLGWDHRPWHVVLSAALVTAMLIAVWSLVSSSRSAAAR